MNKKRFLPFVIILILFTVISSCDLIPVGGNRSIPTVKPESIEISIGEDLPSEQDQSPTIAFAPTKTLIPSATTSPTQRLTWTPYPTKTIRPTWTPTKTSTTTSTPEIGWMIKDDFSEDSRVWSVKSGSNWEMGYKRGGYYMLVRTNNVQITSTPTIIKPADVRIIMDVYRLNGKGYWGITCRETHGGSYYTIFINDKGEYGYGETRNGKVSLHILGSSPDIFTEKLKVNKIMAECRGNNLNLFIDEAMIFQVKVDMIGPGWAGMMVGTTDDDNSIEVIFDNIEIWGPVKE